jgi:hypothetical protein
MVYKIVNVCLLIFGFLQNLELQLNGIGFKQTRSGGVETDGRDY